MYFNRLKIIVYIMLRKYIYIYMVVYNDIHKRFRSLLNNKHISQSEFQKVFKLEENRP